MKICPACASQYPDDANFCPMDATRLKPLAPEPAPAFADSQQVIANRFVLGARLGSGPTGESFPATDGTTGERVHLKIIDARVLPTAMQADRALREFKQLAKIRSPRIARIIEQGKLDDGRVFVVTEPLDGPTLVEVVEREGPMSFDRAREVVLGVGEALIEAQKVGVIHRDVAPRNVVLVGGEVKVTEFGVAEPVTERVFGTPAFLSPEQVEGKSVDQRSNIYSLGALLYYLATGVPPFQGDAESILHQHLHTQPRPPSQVRSGLSPDVDKLVLKALEKSGGRRHLTLRQMLTELASLGPGGVGGADDRARIRYTPATEMPVAAQAVTTPSMPAAILGAEAAASAPVRRGTSTQIGISPVPSPVPPQDPVPVVQAAAQFVARATPDAGVRIDQTPNRPIAAPAAVPVQPARAEQSVPVIVDTQAPPRAEPTPVPARVMRPDVTPTAPVRAELDAAATRPTIIDASARAAAQQPTAAMPLPAPTSQEAPAQRETPGAVKAQRQTPSQPQQTVGGRRGFRETGWFKQGEILEQATQGASSDDPFAGPSELPREIDDGSLTAEDHRRLSLKTGRTEAMPVVKQPDMLPGDRMSDEEILAEVNPSRKLLMVSGVGVAVLALLAGVYFFFIRSPAPAPAAGSTPPAATSHP